MIKMNVFVFLSILEAFVIVVLVAIFWYFRAKKYEPYFEANTQPEQYIKRWLTNVMEYTRLHAMSLNKAAKKGDPEAIERRLNMVARLNWLSTERDFVEVGMPKTQYWVDISRHINKLLKRWISVKFIDGAPDGQAIAAALAPRAGEEADTPAESAAADAQADDADTASDLPYDEEDGPPPKDLKARVAYLEKQVRKLSSYKSLFFGLQSTYEEVQKSYKKLKKSLSTMALDAEQADVLQKLLADHEAHESSLEEKLRQLEDNKVRMTAELQQLEALFNMQQQELDQNRTRAPAAPAISSEDQERIRELIDSQQTVLREIMAVIHTLPADADTKMALGDKAKEFERNNREIETCITMLEMELGRLQQELTIHQGAT